MITKTDFITYLDAPKHLWALKNNKIPKQKTEIYLQHLIKQGYETEELAEKYIKTILTQQYKTKNIILQPTTKDKHYQARTDALIENPQTNKWDMYEIKASTKIKKEHKYDITFQYLVFNKEYNLGDCYILHLNKEYYRKGEISLTNLFTATKMNSKIQKLKPEVKKLRYEAHLVSKTKKQNQILSCIKPEHCPCKPLCHPKLPKYSIYDINRLSGNESKIRTLEADGIKSIYDIPKDFKLSEKQRFQVNVAQSKATHIDTVTIRKELNKLTYPLYFIDYETFNAAIPMFDGYKPFDQITFQYSLHIKNSPNSKLKHYEHLETTQTDPIPNLIKSLQELINSKGSIIVWNETFEATQNKRMGEIHPEYKEFCKNMNNRIFDLMIIFRDQFYADPKFKGSYSIKKVLPVLVPQLTYEGMDIGDGATAMAQWYDMVYSTSLSEKKRKSIKQNLLKYCELDTFAMVKIWEVLKKV